MIAVRDVAFAYHGRGKRVFEDITLKVEPGEIFCLLGPNGTGKSTLIKCLAGLLPVDRGKITIHGKAIATLSRRSLARAMAYVPQNHAPVFAFSVRDVVLMGRASHLGLFSSPSARDRRIADRAIAALGIEHLSGKPYTEISGGERQLVMFARVLAQQARVLLLDEPTSHLDFGNQIQVLSLIKAIAGQGLAVIMTSHFPDHAFLTESRTAFLADGRLSVTGTSREIITEERLSHIYGIGIRLLEHGERRVCVPIMPESGQYDLSGLGR